MKFTEVFEPELNEINMSPGSLEKLTGQINAMAGMEFEMIVPGASQDDDDGDLEPDYDSDESISSIQEAYDFFYDGDYNGRRDVERLRERMQSDYQDWLGDQIGDRWETDKVEAIYSWLRYNAAPSDVFGILGVEEDENGNYPDPQKKDYAAAADKVAEDQISPWYEDAEEDFRDDFYSNSDLESEWLEHEGIETMHDVESNYDISWPHWQSPRQGGDVSVDDVADEFSRMIGKPVNASSNYHGARREAGHYVVEPDGSLEPDDDSDGGLEFVSPPLPINELLSDLTKVKAWADKKGCYTNDSTGLHINVSVPNFSLENLDYVKLALLMGDTYVLEQFQRMGNTYCKSAMEEIKRRVVQRPEDAENLLDAMKRGLGNLATKVIHSGATSKYTSINTKTGYVEFRSPGGNWLGDEFYNMIKPTLLRFVVALDAAVDPQKYREEYLKKLYTLLQPKSQEDTLSYFARFAAGELPAVALKSFIRQAQLERKVKKDPTSGQKYWWSVGRPGYFASVNVVATSKEEAIEKGKAEYPDWADARDMTAKPIKPYDESPVKATVGEPQAAGSVGQSTDRPFVWKVIGASDSPYQSQGTEVVASSEFEAMQKARQQWNLNTSGASEEDFFRTNGWRATPVRPAAAAGSTQDLQRQRAQPGSFTGSWRVLVNGQEVHRFGGVGNVQSDANRVAVNWLRDHGYTNQDEVEVLPIVN